MDRQDILLDTYDLKEDLNNSKLYKIMIEKEKEMLEDQDTFVLLNKYQKAKDEYEQSLRFKEYDETYKVKQKQLYEIKILVDTNEFVKQYNKAYKEFSLLLKKIEKEIFKDIIEKKGINICE